MKIKRLYELTTTFETGYTFTEIKFMVNDSLEFENQENRRVDFSQGDTTFTTRHSIEISFSRFL
jgi:hypothetical protein